MCLTAEFGTERTFRTVHTLILESGGDVCRNDAVIIDGTGDTILAGYVWYHVEVDGVLRSLVRMWKAGEYDRNAGAATWITELATTFLFCRKTYWHRCILYN